MNEKWLDLEQIATVEVTSEHPHFPVEAVFDSDGGVSWRASSPERIEAYLKRR